MTDTYIQTYTKVITDRSPFRAFGVTSLQPIIKERSNIYTVVSFLGFNNPKPTPVPGLTVPLVIFTVMVAHSFFSLIL